VIPFPSTLTTSGFGLCCKSGRDADIESLWACPGYGRSAHRQIHRPSGKRPEPPPKIFLRKKQRPGISPLSTRLCEPKKQTRLREPVPQTLVHVSVVQQTFCNVASTGRSGPAAAVAARGVAPSCDSRSYSTHLSVLSCQRSPGAQANPISGKPAADTIGMCGRRTCLKRFGDCHANPVTRGPRRVGCANEDCLAVAERPKLPIPYGRDRADSRESHLRRV